MDNIEYKQTITLTPDQVKAILRDHVAKVFKLSGDLEVSLNVRTSYEDRPCGSEYPEFEEAIVELVTKGN